MDVSSQQYDFTMECATELTVCNFNRRGESFLRG